MAYKILVGIIIGRIIQDHFDLLIDSFFCGWFLHLSAFSATLLLKRYNLILSFILIFYGSINSLSIPKFQKLSLNSAKVINTGILGLSSKHAIAQSETTTTLVKGINLTPEILGIVERGHFKPRSEKFPMPIAQSNLHIWSLKLSNFVLKNTSSLPHSVKGWIEALLLGKLNAISREFQDALKFLGIYHIAIVSGLHLSILSKILNQAFYIPIHILYGLRALPPTIHIFCKLLIDVLFLFFLTIYAESLSFTQPVQRALILFGMGLIHSIFWGRIQGSALIPNCVCFQALIFPLGFFTSSTIMSWGAYLVAVLPEHRVFGSIIWQKLGKQLLLTLLTASIFGEISLMGIIVNLLLSAFFPSLLISGIALVFVHGNCSQIETVLIKYHKILQEFCIYLYDNLYRYQFLYIKLYDHSTLRVIMGLTVGLCLLKIYYERPIEYNDTKT